MPMVSFTILFTIDCANLLIVMGRQYNILARVLLVVHDPTIPQLGPAHKKAKMEVDVSVHSNAMLKGLCR
jgi:hypothetical protein